MLIIILLVLVVFWFLGYINPLMLLIPSFPLFSLNGRIISIWDVLIFLLIFWVISLLPSPFSQIVGLLLLLWLFASFGILAMTGLSSILVIVIIIAIAISITKSFAKK